MGEPGLTSEAALQINQALLFWMAAILFGLACLAGLTALAFVWRECFRSPEPSKRPFGFQKATFGGSSS